MIYKTKYFKLHELIDEATFDYFGESAWQFFNPNALISLDNIREYFGSPVTVNNWYWGGNFQFRGLRPRFTSLGAKHSQHKFGNAFDLDVLGFSAETIRQAILDYKNIKLFSRINRIEADVSWVHFDCKETPNDQRILIIYP